MQTEQTVSGVTGGAYRKDIEEMIRRSLWTTAHRGKENRLYNETCLKRPLSKGPKLVFKTNYRLMQVKSIAECS